MKKLLATLLIGTLLILPAPLLAASDRVNVNTLAFDKIEQHMNTYNAQIYYNNDKVASIEVPSDDVKTGINSMITAATAQDAAYNTKLASLQALLDGGSLDPNIPYLMDIYTSLKITNATNKANLQSQYNSFDGNRDKASEAKTNAAIQTEAGNKQIIWGAEQVYLGYNSLTHQIKQQSSQLEFLFKQQNAMKLRQELGLVTKTTSNSLDKSIKELAFAVKTMREQQSLMKNQLNIMFNQNHESGLSIEATPNLDSNLITSMNFENDYKNAENLSYNVRLKDDSWDREAEQRKFKLDFKKSFDNVFTKQETLEIEQYKLKNEMEVFVQSQLRYDLGLISKLTLDEQKLTLQGQSLKVEIAKEDLFKAYRQYEWLKKGVTL